MKVRISQSPSPRHLESYGLDRPPFWPEKGKHWDKSPAPSKTLLDHILERGMADVTHDGAKSYGVA